MSWVSCLTASLKPSNTAFAALLASFSLAASLSAPTASNIVERLSDMLATAALTNSPKPFMPAVNPLKNSEAVLPVKTKAERSDPRMLLTVWKL